MNVDPTAAADGDEWQDRPVQLNRRTAAAIGLVVVGALLLGLNLGLRQFAGQAKEPENRARTRISTIRLKVRQLGGKTTIISTRPGRRRRSSRRPSRNRAFKPIVPPIRSRKPGGAKRRKRGARDCSRKAHRIFASALASPQPGPARTRSPGLDLAGLNLPSVQDLLPGNAPSAAGRKQAFPGERYGR